MPSKKSRSHRGRSAVQHDRSRGREGHFRMIAGLWRGRRLSFPPITGIRPTPDRVRETLFNWLAPVIEGARCLDLFAGSGALGLEALSRGAASASFVDSHPQAIARILEHLSQLQCDRGDTHCGDAFEYLTSSAAAAVGPYDIVFLDPPFDRDDRYRLFEQLANEKLLAPRAYVYLEMPADRDLPELPAGWQLKHSKTAGQVGYHLWQRTQAGGDSQS